MIVYSELILLNNDVLENVDKLFQLNEEKIGIELMMDGNSWDGYKIKYEDLIAKLRKIDAHYSLHPAAWDSNMTAEMEKLRIAAYELNAEAIDFAREIGALYVVIHPGFVGSPAFSKKTAKDRAKEKILSLSSHARKQGTVKLAVENVGYNGQSLYTEEEFINLLKDFPDNVCYLIDTGHAFLNGWNIPNLIRKTADRLIAMHLHDNNGVSDQHLPIGEGKIQWEPIFEAIRELYDKDGNHPDLVLEFVPGTDLSKLNRCRKLITDTYLIPEI